MRRLVAFLLTLTLLMTFVAGTVVAKPKQVPPGWGQNKIFWDIDEHWGQSFIMQAQARGFFAGYEDGSFRPDKALTSDELAVLIDRLIADLDEDDDEDEDLEDDDRDEVLRGVPTWARNAVWKGNKHGYINLKRYHSAVQMSRLEACVELADALIKAGKLDPVDEDDFFNPFGDCSSISDDDYAKLMALYRAGIIKGGPNGNFNPNSHLTRVHLAVIFCNIDDWDWDRDLTLDDYDLVIEAGEEETVTGTLDDDEMDIKDVDWKITSGIKSIIDDVEITWDDNEFEAIIVTEEDADPGDRCTITFTVEDEEGDEYQARCRITIADDSGADELTFWPARVYMDENDTKKVRIYLPEGYDTGDVDAVDWDSDDRDVAGLNYDEDDLLDAKYYFIVEVESEDVDGNDECTITVDVKVDGDWYDGTLDVEVEDLD